MNATAMRRQRSPLGLPLLCVAVGAALALAVVALAAGSKAAPAFPGWQAVSGYPATGSSVRALLRRCGATAPGGYREHLGRLVISESRGPYAAAVYTGSDRVPGNTSVCISGGSTADGPPAGVCTSSSLALATIPAGRIETAGALQTCDLLGPNGLGLVTFARGRLGAGVTTVTIRRGGGGIVQATVARGWFLAWWPGSGSSAAAAVRTAAGRTRLARLR